MKTPTVEQVRAWGWHRQQLSGTRGATPAALLQETGWMRSVGGCGPYLGLFARGGLSRETVDLAVAELSIHELPSVRGCTYVIPASDFALALRAGQGNGQSSQIKSAKKYLGLTDKEFDQLCRGIVDALAKGPLAPQDLKESLGGLVRHLGDEGKKRGQTTTLPLGLGELQARGEIRRVPTNGRLDQQRYRYAQWRPNPLAGPALSEAELAHGLASRFFRWAGPATAAQFLGWSGLGAKVAKSAVSELGLVALGPDDDRKLYPADLEALRALKPARKEEVALVGSIDNLFHLRREIASITDPSDAKKNLPGEEEKVISVSDLPHHGILVNGRLVGFWQYELSSTSIAYGLFGPGSPAIVRAVKATETFIREQLGDARSFSLDSPEGRVEQIAALRAMGH